MTSRFSKSCGYRYVISYNSINNAFQYVEQFYYIRDYFMSIICVHCEFSRQGYLFNLLRTSFDCEVIEVNLSLTGMKYEASCICS